MADTLTSDSPASWPATPLSHLWKVVGAIVVVAVTVVTTWWPTPLRLDLAILTVAATVGVLPGLAAAVAHATVTLLGDHSAPVVFTAGVTIVGALLGAAVLRRSPRRSGLPSRAAARLLPLVPLAVAVGVATSELATGNDPLATSHLLLAPIKALAALLLAAAIVRGPRRGREAGPVFLSALVAFVTTSIIIITVGLWERQDEALLHSTAEATKVAFLTAVADEMNTVSIKADATATDPITVENFADSVRSTVYGNQAIGGMQLVDLAPDGTVTVLDQLSTLGSDFDRGAAAWLGGRGADLGSAADNGVVTYLGLAKLPHPTLGPSPFLLYSAPLHDPPRCHGHRSPTTAQRRVLRAGHVGNRQRSHHRLHQRGHRLALPRRRRWSGPSHLEHPRFDRRQRPDAVQRLRSRERSAGPHRCHCPQRVRAQ
jgi:hypothetical protein